MKPAALALLALALAGCPAPPRPSETVVVRVDGEGAAPQRRSTVSTPSAKCPFEAKEWSEQDGPLPLRMQPGGPPFAEVSSAALELRVEWAAKVQVRAKAVSSGLTVEAAVAPADVVLFAQRPIAFRGILIPGPHHVLRLAPQSASSALRLRCDYDPDAHLEHPVACEDVGLLPGAFDPFAGRIDDDTSTAYAIDVEALAVASAPDGPRIASFTTDDDAEIFVLERRGDRARIVWPRGDDVVTGWVSTADVGRPLGNRIGQAFGIGGLGLSGTGASPATVCPHPLVLHAEVGGRRGIVGSIAPDTLLELYDELDGYTAVDAQQSGIRAADGAALLVERSALTGCRRP